MKLVSVCIPCHNVEPYVAAALNSVFSQTWQPLEVIVVEDGSTDGTSAILKEFESKGAQIISENFGSAAKARNCAYRHARGDYVKFFDADDLLSAQHIELQMARLHGRMDAIAFSEWGRFYESDLSTFKPNTQTVWRDMEATEWLAEAWVDARPMMQPGMFLIPREIIQTSGAWDEDLTLNDDFEFLARILCNTREVLFARGATLFYRSGLSGSLSGQKHRKAVESAFNSVVRGTGHLLARRDDDVARQSCGNVLQDFIYTYYPEYPDLCSEIEARVFELGGSSLLPDGPPRFHILSKVTGWRLARRLQLLYKKIHSDDHQMHF